MNSENKVYRQPTASTGTITFQSRARLRGGWRATLYRAPSGEWSDDDYDVICDGAVVGRIFKAGASPVGLPWLWTLAFGHLEDRTPTHGYEATRKGRDGGIRQKL